MTDDIKALLNDMDYECGHRGSGLNCDCVHCRAADTIERLASKSDLQRGLVRLAEAQYRKAITRADRYEKALLFARPLVEKWCHYQGNKQALFDQYLGPIDQALSPTGAIQERTETDDRHHPGGDPHQ